MAHFVVKPMLRSNRPKKLKSYAKYHRRLAILSKEAAFFEKQIGDANIENCI